MDLSLELHIYHMGSLFRHHLKKVAFYFVCARFELRSYQTAFLSILYFVLGLLFHTAGLSEYIILPWVTIYIF